MRPLLQILRPLRQAAAAFFSHDLTVQRGKAGMRLVLEERAPAAAPQRGPSREKQATQKEAAELALMLEQLNALLAESPDARKTMRALVFVEQALAKKGLRALPKLPLDVLQRALDQLEGLVTNWSPRGLAGLRSRMAVAIIDREHMDPQAEADDYRTTAVLDTQHEVAEAPGSQDQDDGDALAAAYAALGNLAPAAPLAPVEIQAELGSPSARGLTPPPPGPPAAEIRLRELQG